MMAPWLRPAALAASTNSFCFSDSVWPRTIRDMVSHSTAPMATKIRKMFRPKVTISRMTKKMKGSE
ncbi:hypothetical protein D3C83_49000 [compost metagenome]